MRAYVRAFECVYACARVRAHMRVPVHAQACAYVRVQGLTLLASVLSRGTSQVQF